MLISIGNFFFKWRDKVFPLVMLSLLINRPLQGSVFGLNEDFLDILGVVVMIVGESLRIGVVGLQYIRRGGLEKKVYADDLVTGGLFTLCRNPLYVGNILIATGALLIHAQPALMVAGIGMTLFVYVAIVAAEEHFLRGKFGSGYDDYCADVSRWLPNLTRLSAATTGNTFNIRRVIEKEYSTIFGMATGITVLLAYDVWIKTSNVSMLTWGVFAVLAFLLIGIKTLKKSGYLSRQSHG